MPFVPDSFTSHQRQHVMYKNDFDKRNVSQRFYQIKLHLITSKAGFEDKYFTKCSTFTALGNESNKSSRMSGLKNGHTKPSLSSSQTGRVSGTHVLNHTYCTTSTHTTLQWRQNRRTSEPITNCFKILWHEKQTSMNIMKRNLIWRIIAVTKLRIFDFTVSA